MKLFRNTEVVKSTAVFAAVSGIAALAAWRMWNRNAALFVLLLGAVLLAVHLLTTHRRYSKLAEFSAEIDRILHNGDHVSLEQYSEGELGILQSEICKMTVRLREQQQRLLDDKIFLADSIADISHQIRTPLTSINLLVSFLSEPELTGERRQELVRELYDLLSRIDWLITTLLKISRLDAGTVQFKAEQVTLEELAQKACAPLLVPVELRDQTLEIQAQGSFSGDLAWTAEALGNIIKNCMEHTPEGGRITVHAQETALYAEIVITDNGSGIAKEDLPHIFERFYKGQNSDDKSFGIGLALSRMIVTAQNGTLKAENLSDGGARFTARFYKGTV